MATAIGFVPPSMNWENDDLPDELARFKQYCELIFNGPYSEKSNSEKVSYTLLWIGRTGLDLYNSFTWASPDDKTDLGKIWEKFETHLSPKVNHRLARHQLHQFKQKMDEPVDDFMSRCRNHASKCRFRDNIEVEERLIEQLIIGSKHKKVQERILAKGEDLSLDAAMDVARTYEATISHMDRLTDSQNQNVLSMNYTKPYNDYKCKHCGLNHPEKPKNKCPAHGSLCNNCGKPNHWSSVCYTKKNNQGRSRSKERQYNRSRYRSKSRNRGKSPGNRKGQRINSMTYNPSPDDLSDSFEHITFGSVGIDSMDKSKDSSQNEVFVSIDIDIGRKCPTSLNAKLDTGAQGNILPLRIYSKMFPDNISDRGYPKANTLKQNHTILTAYGGTQIKQHGICSISCTYGEKSATAAFYVTEATGPAIIGLPTSLALNLVTLNCSVKTETQTASPITDKNELLAQYPDIFEGVGKFHGQYHITLEPTVPPVVHAPRRVPISMKDDIRKELEEMESQNIITKVREGEPTAWVNSLVYRRKPNGRIRICLDPKDLNRSIKRDHHVTPTLEEILPKLNGAKVFTMLDAKCGYWNVELDTESSYLTTFNSPFGRYRFLRMPFGLKMSQDVFQSKIDQAFERCEGAISICDDIVVYGSSTEDHDNHLRGVMQRCRDTGLKLNPDKARVRQDNIKFFGIICSQDGAKPDPAKVSAIRQMKPPQNTKELQTFLGLATYMGPFVPNLSTESAPLRDMLKKDSTFEWNASQQKAFDNIKQLISAQITLGYFDPSKETTLQVDASTKGLGAALIQEGKPIAFASKALTDAESRYANIERELLAAVYGCERFHTYLYGRHFTVESDHKPLEAIHLKHLIAAPPRLQRMLLRLQAYDLTIKYKPGKEMFLADALSRLSPEETMPIPDMDVHIHEVCPQFTSKILDQIRTETGKDPELNALKEVVYTGWPCTQAELTSLTRPYWPYRDELTVDDGIVMKGHRILIPQKMQNDVLAQLHTSHQGCEKTKLRARTSVFWRNLNKDIDEITRTCVICQEHKPSQSKEPLIQSEIPPRAWHTIGTDLFFCGGEEYLLVADYYSKFQFVRKISPKQSTSKNVIEFLKQIFCEQGIPQIVRSDNGPQYDSYLFKEFASAYGFKHETSSPHYPKSNGFIESQVKIVKRTLIKAGQSKIDPYMALLCLKATPIDHRLPTPAELLLGRPIQDNLPRKIPCDLQSESVKDRFREKQVTQKHYHDKTVKLLPPLDTGQIVTIQDPVTHKWKPGVIKRRSDYPRSYTVTSSEGNDLRRNRSHIRECPPSTQKRVRFNLEKTETFPCGYQTAPIPLKSANSTECKLTDSKNFVSTPPRNETYTTRSGRNIKPPAIMDL